MILCQWSYRLLVTGHTGSSPHLQLLLVVLVVPVTVTVPLAVLLLVLLRTDTLPGTLTGTEYYYYRLSQTYSHTQHTGRHS